VAWFTWFDSGQVTVYEVSRKARLETDSAPREISALQAGRLATSRLQIGRDVRAGDVLIELDAEAEKLRLAEEEERVRGTPAKIESLRRQIEALKQAAVDDGHSTEAATEAAQAHLNEAAASADFAADNAKRMQAESRAGSVAEIDALRATADAQKAGAQHDALAADARKLQLDARIRARESQAKIEDLNRTLVSLQSEIDTAKATVSRLKLDIENHRVRAPVDGVIGEALELAPGAFVTQGQKLATIVPKGDLLIVAEFNPSSALGRLRPGQTARLRLDGFPWAQYGTVDAHVLRVASEIRDGALRVELTPGSSGANGVVLRHGLTGSVEVGVESVSPAILLLRSAGQMAGNAPSPAPLQTAESMR